MHKKFIEKRQRDELLEEMENTKKDIEGLYYSMRLLREYCVKYQDMKEIKMMSHLITVVSDNLFCLFKELENIVNKEKYQIPDFMENLGSYITSEKIIFEDD